jgi:thiamine transport system ATP-binding protein
MKRDDLSVRGLRVVVDGRPIIDGVDLDAPAGEVTTILGASGSGKTTILRAAAGLVPVDAGSIRIGGRDVTNLPTHRRGVGLMFQDLALFPHLDVGANVAFGLRMRGAAQGDRVDRVGTLLSLVGLDGSERRAVQTLSGGERQRVALARALAPSPSVLMLDEPLGAIDRALRDRLLDELEAIVRTVGVTTVYVTHDQAEAFRLATRVAVVHDGRIVQSGTPEGVWSRPVDEPTARLLGHRNIVREDGRRLLLRADGLSLARPTATDGRGARPARVAAASFDSGRARLRLRLPDGTTLEVEEPLRERWREGDAALVIVDPGARVDLGPDPRAGSPGADVG